MGVKVKRNDLSSYIKKLEKIENLDELGKKITLELANEGVDYANVLYKQDNIQVDFDISQTDKGFSVVAMADGLAFEEFGTGSVGRDSNYEGNLPIETINFTTSKGSFSTQGWEYNYDSPHKIRSKESGRIKGWINPETKKFTRGQKAGQQMYDTSVHLQNSEDIIEKTIKEFIEND